MSEQPLTIQSSLSGLSETDWLAAVARICDKDGYLERLGPRHVAAFIEAGPVLLVSFETIHGIHALSDLAHPLGWEMVRDERWSHLCIASDGDTWFRDEQVWGYVDRLVDDGFFDEFESVLFYGAGPCGYAAAAFAVAAPGARVLAIQPQATLDPRLTEWDDRFPEMRIQDFTSRYGYAPDMLDAVDRAYVIYDPREKLDAMHAALFTRPNVTKLRMRFMGDALQTDLLEMETWAPLLLEAAAGTLDVHAFARLYRARRKYRPYLRNLMSALDGDGRDRLTLMLCRSVADRMGGRRFINRLAQLEQVQKRG